MIHRQRTQLPTLNTSGNYNRKCVSPTVYQKSCKATEYCRKLRGFVPVSYTLIYTLIRSGAGWYRFAVGGFAVRLSLWNPVRLRAGNTVLIGAMVDMRDLTEIAVRYRRWRLPFQGVRVPRILFGYSPLKHTPEHIHQQEYLSGTQNERTDGDELVYPLKMCQIGVKRIMDAPTMSSHAEDVHREKHTVKGDEREPEVDLAKCRIHVPPEHLGEPVEDRAEQRKHTSAEDNIVDMCDDVVGIVDVDVYRRIRHVDTAKPADYEHGDKSERMQHGHCVSNRSTE